MERIGSACSTWSSLVVRPFTGTIVACELADLLRAVSPRRRES